jgi:hypothetical protein
VEKAGEEEEQKSYGESYGRAVEEDEQVRASSSVYVNPYYQGSWIAIRRAGFMIKV